MRWLSEQEMRNVARIYELDSSNIYPTSAFASSPILFGRLLPFWGQTLPYIKPALWQWWKSLLITDGSSRSIYPCFFALVSLACLSWCACIKPCGVPGNAFTSQSGDWLNRSSPCLGASSLILPYIRRPTSLRKRMLISDLQNKG